MTVKIALWIPYWEQRVSLRIPHCGCKKKTLFLRGTAWVSLIQTAPATVFQNDILLGSTILVVNLPNLVVNPQLFFNPPYFNSFNPQHNSPRNLILSNCWYSYIVVAIFWLTNIFSTSFPHFPTFFLFQSPNFVVFRPFFLKSAPALGPPGSHWASWAQERPSRRCRRSPWRASELLGNVGIFLTFRGTLW